MLLPGMLERGDIHQHALATVGPARAAELPTLAPAAIADTARELSARRDRAEATFNALG